ncbi:hypothetical protein KAR91_06780 [Candidatus Pacearchaeota archaeon]|nr:hypothetical protein [Candidatus Pacearchaeota archaeon]
MKRLGTLAGVVLATWFVLVIPIYNIAYAWHGNVTKYEDCYGWSVEVDTVWDGHKGEVDWITPGYSGDWSSGDKVTVKGEIVWNNGERWSFEVVARKPEHCTPTPTFVPPTETSTSKPPTETPTPIPPTNTPDIPTATPTNIPPTATPVTPTNTPASPTETPVFIPTFTLTPEVPTETPTPIPTDEPTPEPSPMPTEMPPPVPQELPKVGLSYADWAPGVWGLDGYDNVLLTHNGRPTSVGSEIVWLEEGDVFIYEEEDYVVAKYMEVAPEDVWVLDDAYLYDLVFLTCSEYSWSDNEWNTRVLVFLERE